MLIDYKHSFPTLCLFLSASLSPVFKLKACKLPYKSICCPGLLHLPVQQNFLFYSLVLIHCKHVTNFQSPHSLPSVLFSSPSALPAVHCGYRRRIEHLICANVSYRDPFLPRFLTPTIRLSARFPIGFHYNGRSI